MPLTEACQLRPSPCSFCCEVLTVLPVQHASLVRPPGSELGVAKQMRSSFCEASISSCSRLLLATLRCSWGLLRSNNMFYVCLSYNLDVPFRTRLCKATTHNIATVQARGNGALQCLYHMAFEIKCTHPAPVGKLACMWVMGRTAVQHVAPLSKHVVKGRVLFCDLEQSTDATADECQEDLNELDHLYD